MKDDRAPAHCAALSTEDYARLTGFDGDWRDTWWRDDFLALMARRWDLASVGQVLDVGCGVSHWGQRLMRHLPSSTRLFGVDAEATWVDRARKRAGSLGLADRTEYQTGVAEALPWPDHSFDMVTCQTVLIHVPQVRAALAEMMRVLRPGGLLLVAEPNNFGSGAAQLVESPLRSWAEASDLLELDYRSTQGKLALGEGHQSAGHLVPGCLRSLGCTDIGAALNNQTALVVPPYTDAGSRGMIAFMRSCHASGAAMVLGSTRDGSKRYFLAGGGDEARFEHLWQLARTRLETTLSAIDAGTYISAGGHIHYLVWGRRPTSP